MQTWGKRGAVVMAAVTAMAAGCSSSTPSAATPVATLDSTTSTTVATISGQLTKGAGRYVAPAPARVRGCSSSNGLPDARCTPGATDPRVTQANIASTICVAGYTKTVRPPTSVTTPIKRERLTAYGDAGPLSQYELDHLIPLELGGAPRSVANLWPEPWNGSAGARGKDVVENELHKDVCNGTLSLAVAQRAIATNWRTAVP